MLFPEFIIRYMDRLLTALMFYSYSKARLKSKFPKNLFVALKIFNSFSKRKKAYLQLTKQRSDTGI